MFSSPGKLLLEDTHNISASTELQEKPVSEAHRVHYGKGCIKKFAQASHLECSMMHSGRIQYQLHSCFFSVLKDTRQRKISVGSLGLHGNYFKLDFGACKEKCVSLCKKTVLRQERQSSWHRWASSRKDPPRDTDVNISASYRRSVI